MGFRAWRVAMMAPVVAKKMAKGDVKPRKPKAGGVGVARVMNSKSRPMAVRDNERNARDQASHGALEA